MYVDGEWRSAINLSVSDRLQLSECLTGTAYRGGARCGHLSLCLPQLCTPLLPVLDLVQPAH